jgi:hypothetical protein
MIPAPSRQLEPQEADDGVTTGVQFRYGTVIGGLLRLGWALLPGCAFSLPFSSTLRGGFGGSHAARGSAPAERFKVPD